MTAGETLFDKILHSKQMNEAYQFNPDDLVDEVLKQLSLKEKEILAKRFGLIGHEPHTLEQIGSAHSITRERIRQIQNSSIKKIRELQGLKATLDFINQTIIRLLEEHGGIMEESHFFDELLAYTDKSNTTKRSTDFIVSQLLDTKIERVKKSDRLLPGWVVKTVSFDFLHNLLDEFEKTISEHDNLIDQTDFLNAFKRREFYEKNKDDLIPLGVNGFDDSDRDKKINRILESYMKICRKIDVNLLDKWGLTKWPTITPKRMGDKIYLVLTKTGEPLHFSEIAEEINKANFDKKVAYPATIHNELILDDRYVLVGRGIYALKEWGYESGTVSEVIEEILKNFEEPLSKQQILDAVSKKRIVKKSTVYLALSNKDKFKKVGEQYTLV